jgi:opacity protein-like surface antigen
MKKLLIAAACVAGFSASAQIKFGVRGNVLLNSSKFDYNNLSSSNIANTLETSKRAGFNLGFSTKIDIPVLGWFVMPEIYFTNFSNKITEQNTNQSSSFNNSRIDIPVLFGKNILVDNFGLFAGPVASYQLTTANSLNINSNSSLKDLTEKASNKFTFGYQVGAHLILSNYVLNARYEGAFSQTQRNLINTVADTRANFDERQNLIILGLGYNF